MGPGVRNGQCDAGRHRVESQETDEEAPSYSDADTLRNPSLSIICVNTLLRNDYIMAAIPIYSTNNVEGCGFIIGRYCITAGHVITGNENPHIIVNQKRINLINPIFFEDDENDPMGYDLAIYDCGDLHSELDLYDGEITLGQILHSYSFKELGTQYVECDIEVCDYNEGNYFGGIASINLKAGCSGSPVLLGDRVAGMIVKGNNDDMNELVNQELPLSFCIFLSSSAIKRVLSNILKSKIVLDDRKNTCKSLFQR